MNRTKLSLIYGGAAGVIMILSWWISNFFFFNTDEGFDFQRSEFIGYVAMLLALSMVFIGIRNYRNKQHGGIINFKEAFLTGLYIVLVASAIYVIGWMIYYPNFMPDFMEQYNAHQIQQYEEAGMNATEIQERRQQMDEYAEWYKNPFIVAGMTFMEIFPIGLIIAAISALILRRKLH